MVVDEMNVYAFSGVMLANQDYSACIRSVVAVEEILQLQFSEMAGPIVQFVTTARYLSYLCQMESRP